MDGYSVCVVAVFTHGLSIRALRKGPSLEEDRAREVFELSSFYGRSVGKLAFLRRIDLSADSVL